MGEKWFFGSGKVVVTLLVILIVFLGAVFLVGREPDATGRAVANPNTLVCNKPYILVGSSCCLDKDDNSICDKDETVEEKNGSGETAKLYQPLEIEESCRGTVHFDCLWGEITKEGVRFKFQMKKPGLVVVKRVELSGIPGSCARDFDDVSMERGFRFGDTPEFSVQCRIDKEFAESNIDIYVDYYPKEGFKYENLTEWTGEFSIQQIRSQGYVSGMVR